MVAPGWAKRRAAVGLDQASGDLEQGGFARAVAPHQRQPLALAHASSAPSSSLVVPKVR